MSNVQLVINDNLNFKIDATTGAGYFLAIQLIIEKGLTIPLTFPGQDPTGKDVATFVLITPQTRVHMISDHPSDNAAIQAFNTDMNDVLQGLLATTGEETPAEEDSSPSES